MVIKVNKSAREMFEDLGYEREETLNQIIYDNKRQFIEFNKNSFIVFMNGKFPYQGFGFNNNKIIKAINKQCKELGWLDE